MGRKRHIVVDVLGLLLVVVVHSAGIQDRNGAKQVLTRLISYFPGLKLVWADGAYAGKLTVYLENGGRLEHAQQMAGHESPRTTKLYDRTKDEITVTEVERIRL
jgi:hypothetical protein